MIGRDTTEGELWIHKETLECALSDGCIACLYKLSPTGKVGEIDFPPNVRPELCPRSTRNNNRVMEAGIFWRSRKERVLTCGDGDFTFSLSLSNAAVCKEGFKGELVATSHETKESVLNTYGDPARDTLHALKENGTVVLHGVDATKLESIAAAGVRKKPDKKFDKIVWNFPCIGQGLSAGADGQSSEMEANKTLVKDFFRSASKLLADDGGEIHVAHKTIEPFCWWGMGALGTESDCGIEHVCSVAFDRMLFPGYINRKALHRKSFPSHDAQVYVFKKIKKKKTKEEMMAGGDGDGDGHTANDDDDGNPSGSDNQPAWLQERCHALNVDTIPALEGRIEKVLAKRKIEDSKKRKRRGGKI